MPKTVIRLKDIRKSYRINSDNGESKKLFRKRETEEFVVFDNVNLEVREGDVLAILGRNGAGKSTFLKIVSEIIEPDSGIVEVSGKIASILELSIGFHNDLTGRENIYLRSELYGVPRRKVGEYIDEIIEYSDLGKFIDNPVRTYSSGMRSRLAFAIMVNVDADVFLVDEALSTGDAAFASKASEHLKNLVRQGKTVLMTSHNIRTIRSTCTRAIWLSEKTIFMDGDVNEVCDAYSRSIMESFEETLKLAQGGASSAQYRLAGYYRHGVHVEQNHAESRRWLEEAAKRGHVPAMSEYADLLLEDDPVANRDEVLSLYRAAAEGGNFDSRRRYAYLRGEVDKDAGFLREILAKIADSGYPTDICTYAHVVSFSAMNDADRTLAFDLYSRAAAMGNAEACYRMGTLLRGGIGTEQSIERAMEAFETAAGLGSAKAMMVLADLYEDGRHVERDLNKAFEWYLAAADSGNTRAQYQVAMMLSDGIGTEKNDELANVWFRRHSESALNEYRMYAVDVIRRRRVCSKGDAVKLLESASDCGFNKATVRIADMKLRGTGMEKDVPGAFELYELAAKRVMRNRTDLADAIMECEPDEDAKARSFHLYEQAANNGDAYAMYALACMYRDGSGVPENRDMYKYYTHMAANFGNKDALAVVQKWVMKEKKRKKREQDQSGPA